MDVVKTLKAVHIACKRHFKKIILLTIFILLAVFEYSSMTAQTKQYHRSLREVSCYGKDLVIQKTACCHDQCKNLSRWPTKEAPPPTCLASWEGVAYAK